MRFFSTISQASRSNYRFKKSPATRTFKLVGKPQISGMVWDVSVKRPKKPNSGKRHVSKVKIIKLFRITRLTARLLGSDFWPQKYKRVLVRGGRSNDVPGVSYTIIRGALQCPSLVDRKRRRSLYGIKRDEALRKRIPKYLRLENAKATTNSNFDSF